MESEPNEYYLTIYSRRLQPGETPDTTDHPEHDKLLHHIVLSLVNRNKSLCARNMHSFCTDYQSAKHRQ